MMADKIVLAGLLVVLPSPEAFSIEHLEYLQQLAAADEPSEWQQQLSHALYLLELPPEPKPFPFIEPSPPASVFRERGEKESQRREWNRMRNRRHKEHTKAYQKRK